MSVFTDTFFHPFARLALPLQDWEDSDGTKDTAVSTRPTPSNWMNASNLFHGPRIDIHEHSDHYSVTAELAGAKKEDVKCSLDSATRKLTLSGETRSEYSNVPQQDTKTTGADDASKKAQPGTETAAKQAQAEKDVSVTKTDGNNKTLDQHHHHGPRPLITERIYGSFSRSFILPKDADVDSEHIKGKFDNGVLKLTIPKKETTKRQVRNVTIEDVAE